MGKGILNRGTQVHRDKKRYNRKTMKPIKNISKTALDERKKDMGKDISEPPRIGDKVYFEVEDELHEGKMRMVHAKILRAYPKHRGNCCTYLAYDCVDLDIEDTVYTIPYEKEFIKVDPG